MNQSSRRWWPVTGGSPAGEPKSLGLPGSELNARYGDDDAHLWEAGIPAPIYGPSGGSYGEDFTDIDEMVLCSQVLALTALDICA